LRDLRETFRVAWRDQQPDVRQFAVFSQLLEGRDNDLFFAVARAARDDERRSAEGEGLIEPFGDLFEWRGPGRLADVVFDVAADADPLTVSAERDGAPGIGLALHREVRHLLVHPPDQKAELLRARKRSVRDPAVDDDHRDAAPL